MNNVGVSRGIGYEFLKKALVVGYRRMWYWASGAVHPDKCSPVLPPNSLVVHALTSPGRSPLLSLLVSEYSPS